MLLQQGALANLFDSGGRLARQEQLRLQQQQQQQAAMMASAQPIHRMNAPSGIAQLRKSSEQNFNQPDPMNIDDFIYAENMATPGDYSSPQPMSSKQMDESRSGAPAHSSLTSAIPIKSRKDAAALQQQQQQQDQFVPQSMPFPPQHQQRTRDEFNYVPRHPRKTSIDERRVSPTPTPPVFSFCLHVHCTTTPGVNPPACLVACFLRMHAHGP